MIETLPNGVPPSNTVCIYGDLGIEPEFLGELHKNLRVCTLYCRVYEKKTGQDEKNHFHHGHTLNRFRLPSRQLGLPGHIVILKNAQAK